MRTGSPAGCVACACREFDRTMQLSSQVKSREATIQRDREVKAALQASLKATSKPGGDTPEQRLAEFREKEMLLEAQRLEQRTMFDLRHQEGSADWDDTRASGILEREWLLRFFHKTFAPNTMGNIFSKLFNNC